MAAVRSAHSCSIGADSDWLLLDHLQLTNRGTGGPVGAKGTDWVGWRKLVGFSKEPGRSETGKVKEGKGTLLTHHWQKTWVFSFVCTQA
jgi:hypothetical protein